MVCLSTVDLTGHSGHHIQENFGGCPRLPIGVDIEVEMFLAKEVLQRPLNPLTATGIMRSGIPRALYDILIKTRNKIIYIFIFKHGP